MNQEREYLVYLMKQACDAIKRVFGLEVKVENPREYPTFKDAVTFELRVLTGKKWALCGSYFVYFINNDKISIPMSFKTDYYDWPKVEAQMKHLSLEKQNIVTLAHWFYWDAKERAWKSEKGYD